MSTIGVKAIKYPDGDSAINITDGGNVTLAGTLNVTGAFTSQGIDDNADALAITITSDEKVGIGTASPTQLLDVVGGSANIRVAESGGGDLRMNVSGSTGGIGTHSNHPLIFRTNSAERMRIDSSGRVGIFESSPAAGLHITSTNNDLSKIRLGYSTSNHFLEIGRQAGYYRLASFEDGQSLTFGTSRSAGATTERMRINADGQTTISNQPSFQGGIGALHGAGTLKCNSVYHNQGSHYSTSTGLFTAPVTGKYLVGIMVMTQSNYTLDVGMTINGSVSNMFVPYQAATGGGHQQVSGVAVVAVSANDTIGFNVNSGDVYGGSNGRHSSVTFHLLS